MTAGPVGTMLLGDFGADVIKVEEIERGDLSRNIGTVFVKGESVQFMSENRNKRSIRLDLKHPQGRELFLRLAQECDVITENFRPGTVDRLGIGYEDVKKVNPGIVYASVSAFGQSGPYAHLPANDPIIQALSGLMAMTGEPDGPPMRLGNPYPDFGGAAMLAFAVSTALLHRERTGEGQYLDLSLLEAAVFSTIPRDGETLVTGKAPERLGSASPVFTPYQVFYGSDGQAFFVACFTQKFWIGLCRALEKTEWLSNEKYATNPSRCLHRSELVNELDQQFRSKDSTHWLDRLGSHGVPAAKVQDLHQALRDDPQLENAGMLVKMEHGKAGTIETLAAPVRLHRTPARYELPPPVFGEHTYEVLKEFGVHQDEIARWLDQGVIAGTPDCELEPSR